MTVRIMKTKWGSCSYKNNIITLNAYLIEHSIELIELVILHELLHFIHPNHSSEFYKLHEKLMPDYKEREEQLNKEIIRII
jgi:predicted metal-dependent hydrolase